MLFPHWASGLAPATPGYSVSLSVASLYTPISWFRFKGNTWHSLRDTHTQTEEEGGEIRQRERGKVREREGESKREKEREKKGGGMVYEVKE